MCSFLIIGIMMLTTGSFLIASVGQAEHLNYADLMEGWRDRAKDQDSKVIYTHIAEYLKNGKPSVFADVFVCMDSEQNTRSIALTKFEDMYSKDPAKTKKYLKVTYLATSPDSKKQGAGSFLMNYLMDLSVVRETSGVYLNSIGSARGFYEKKMHFKPLSSYLSPYDERYDGQFPMLLSAEKIVQLKQKRAEIR